MPIGTPITLGTPVQASGSATTIALTTSAASPAGSYVLLTVVCDDAQTVSSATDSNGNTYTVGATQVDPGSNIRITRLRAPSAAQLNSASTITVTFSATTPNRMLSAASVTGLAAASVLDVEATNSQADVVDWTAAATTTNADDLLYASSVSVIGNPTNTATGSFTELHDWTLSGGQVSVCDEYQIVSATGTYTATGTWSGAAGSRRLANVISAYKADATGGITLTPATSVNAAQALSYSKTYQSSWGDLGIEYGMLPFSGENFTGASSRRRYSLPPMSP
jgi:hypothetical protein